MANLLSAYKYRSTTETSETSSSTKSSKQKTLKYAYIKGSLLA